MKAPTAGGKTADKAVGSTRSGLNTKLHAIVDGLGNPVTFLLSAGNDHDSTHAIELLDKLEISGSNVLADRAYGAQAIRTAINLSQKNSTSVIFRYDRFGPCEGRVRRFGVVSGKQGREQPQNAVLGHLWRFVRGHWFRLQQRRKPAAKTYTEMKDNPIRKTKKGMSKMRQVKLYKCHPAEPTES